MSDKKAPPGTGDAAERPSPEPPPPSAWRRLLWLMLPVGYWLVASRVPLPGIDTGVFERELPWATGVGSSLLMAGLTPLVAGYLLVEIGAVVVPAWRPLRHTRRGRGALARAAFLGAMVATLFFAWKTLPGLSEMGALAGSAFLPVVTMLGSTALLWIVVHASDSRSAGSALALLVGLSSAVELVRNGIVGSTLTAGAKDLPQPLTSVLLTFLALAATVLVLRARAGGLGPLAAPSREEVRSAGATSAREAPGDESLSIRIPLGGLVPVWGIEILSAAMVFAVTSGLWPSAFDAFDVFKISWPLTAALIGIGVVVAIEVAFSWPSSAAVWGALFGGQEAVPDETRRLAIVSARRTKEARGAPYEEGAPPAGKGSDGAADGDGAGVEKAIGAAYAPPRDVIAEGPPAIARERGAERMRRIRSLLLRAMAPTIAYLAIVAWPAWPILDRPGGPGRAIGAMAGACLLAAAFLDLFAEIRFRLAHRDAASVLVLPHVGSADAGLAALAEVEVPAFARNVNVRVLLGFFGPFAPIEILVPASRLAAARERLAAVLPVEPEIRGPGEGESARESDSDSATGEATAAPRRKAPRNRRKRPAS